MSKPRCAAELSAWAALEETSGLSPEEFVRQWNGGARKADATWADTPKGDGYDYNQPNILHDKYGDPIKGEKQ